ncbi:cyclic nucleotide-gated channel rod photoreceptor subunit alpha [Austrofundulus limnaeus]|uniref:Cyclic nucleotide-gated channel rod photoreceptor subunit alpha n=1 Tax=Austrofundulus limnaeus TaxID=52670 RepID=A0A2I4D765_AUSLI|nr:PREDICTED: cyclic nucleotide-gated channel rod photoreceptor subunit alpha-like [Austrofundulus limnaeus]
MAKVGPSVPTHGFRLNPPTIILQDMEDEPGDIRFPQKPEPGVLFNVNNSNNNEEEEEEKKKKKKKKKEKKEKKE